MTDTTPTRTRFEGYDFAAVVAADTFDPLVERVRAILVHERRMVLISRYANPKGADNLDIKVGLRLNDEPDHSGKVEPIKVNSSTFQNVAHRSLQVALSPGTTGFGFSTDTRNEAQMQRLYDRRGDLYDSPVTYVHVSGWPETPQRDDRIEIEFWNEHRVCILTTVAFQADWG